MADDGGVMEDGATVSSDRMFVMMTDAITV